MVSISKGKPWHCHGLGGRISMLRMKNGGKPLTHPLVDVGCYSDKGWSVSVLITCPCHGQSRTSSNLKIIYSIFPSPTARRRN